MVGPPDAPGSETRAEPVSSTLASVRGLYASIGSALLRTITTRSQAIAIATEILLVAALAVARIADTPRDFLGLWTVLLGIVALISPSTALVVLLAFVPFSEWMVVGGVGMKVVIIAMIGMGFVLRLTLARRTAKAPLPIRLGAVLLVATAITVLHTAIRMPELAAPAAVAWLAGIGGGLVVLIGAWAAGAAGNVRPAVAALVALGIGAAASLLDFLVAGAVRESVFDWLLRPDRLGLPRVTGIIPAPNAVATVLLCALAVLVAVAVLGHGRRRLVLAVPIAVLLVTIVLTYSRSGLLGIFAIVVLVIAYRRPWAAAVVLVAGLVLSVIAIPAYLQFRTAALGSGEITDVWALLSGDLKRLEGWGAALRMWRDEPLTGFGFLSFKALALDYGTTYVTAPHNEFLRLLAEGGIGVAVAFLAFVVATMRALWRSATPFALGALGALIGLVLGGMFNNPFLYVQVMAPVFAIVGTALGRPRASQGRRSNRASRSRPRSQPGTSVPPRQERMARRRCTDEVGRWAHMSARADTRDPRPNEGSEPGPSMLRPSVFRRLLGVAPAAPAAAAPAPAPTELAPSLPARSLEAELAERLDTVLGIAERLAGSHDREELFRTIVDETRRALRVDYVTIRILRDDQLVPAAWAGLDDDVAAALPAFGVGEGWVGEVLRTGRVVAYVDARTDPRHGADRYDGVVEFAGDLVAPLIHHDRVIGALSAVTREPRTWTEGDIAFITTLATHAGIALTNAELFERTEVRAGQLTALQAASRRLSRASSVESVGRTVVEEARRVIDYHNARVYLIELPDQVVPIAFEGRVGAYEHVDLDLLRCRLGEGFTGWVALHGEPLLVNDANADPRGQTIAGTDDIDESMLVVPMRYDGVTVGVITLSKLGVDGFDDDDLRMLTILADQAATAVETARLLTRSQELARELRRLLDMSGELSESLDSRQVANLMAGHLARAMGADECAISYWDRATGRVESLGYHPPLRLEELEPYFEVAGFPDTLRALERQEVVIIDSRDPTADPAEVELLVRDGNRTLVMLPLVAKGQAIGLVELFSQSALSWDAERLDLAQTMANEAAMALENARLYEDARKLADRDPLTGFYNHRFLHERLGEEVVRSQRGRQPLSVLMVDLDDFKLVNDTFGHLFGDRVLTWTAELIRSSLRASDIPARYGGDEFAVVLPETDADEARVVADRILEAFRDRPFVGEQRGPVPIAASIGVATFPADGRTGTELIAAADAALYAVKRAGGHDAAAAGDGVAA